jgi:hypothetical protein
MYIVILIWLMGCVVLFRLHQEVVLGFLKSAKKMLTIDGEILNGK